ncbi:MAG: low molecular weight protein-tyrosine-phosphatase [Dokdonia sp.]|jgi:protein-tyrosine phosphatase
MAKTKILMVCLGNICRSPLAEGILTHKLDPEQFLVDSVGTGSWHVGDPPDKRSIAVAAGHGIDINHLRGRQLSVNDFENFDHIYVMDQSNLADVLALREKSNSSTPVTMILDSIFPGENVDVPDPYHGGREDFKKVFDMLDQACDKIAERLEKRQ